MRLSFLTYMRSCLKKLAVNLVIGGRWRFPELIDITTPIASHILKHEVQVSIVLTNEDSVPQIETDNCFAIKIDKMMIAAVFFLISL